MAHAAPAPVPAVALAVPPPPAPVAFTYVQPDPALPGHFDFIETDAAHSLLAVFPDGIVDTATTPGQARLPWIIAQVFLGAATSTTDPVVLALKHEPFHLSIEKMGDVATFVQRHATLDKRLHRGELLADLVKLGRERKGCPHTNCRGSSRRWDDPLRVPETFS